MQPLALAGEGFLLPIFGLDRIGYAAPLGWGGYEVGAGGPNGPCNSQATRSGELEVSPPMMGRIKPKTLTPLKGAS